jgi:CMP-2-keto-3-deoxyoctulosonic acid synthetase
MNGENVVIIPARLDSTRLPGKVLLKESGKYLLQHVYEQALKSKAADFAVIATDSQEVMEACSSFGAHCVLTSRQHQSGTDRVCEAAQSLGVQRIVNVQADEPLIDPANIDN